MDSSQKKIQLRRHKMLATGIFLLMALVFVVMEHLGRQGGYGAWTGYVKAFAEAAMIGGLADWFAVTALFHHPLGLKIPHTNLIVKSKEKIGDNLGLFVVENFLSTQNIRPYFKNIKVAHLMGAWLGKEKNQKTLVQNISDIFLDILHKLEDEEVVAFISTKAQEMADQIKINHVLASGMEYMVEKGGQEKMITALASQIKGYVLQHHEMVRERVKKESFRLLPNFVDEKIADKITTGLAHYFEEVEQDETHALRKEISEKLLAFSQELKVSPKYEEELQQMKHDFLQPEKMQHYAAEVWASLKKTLHKELQQEDSAMKNYVKKNLQEFSHNLLTDESLQHKIDHWVRVTAYKYTLRNIPKFGELISTTVGNWPGEELSQKLELEVGKDLQFIRINGTLVGGLVGLVIYSITQLL